MYASDQIRSAAGGPQTTVVADRPGPAPPVLEPPVAPPPPGRPSISDFWHLARPTQWVKSLVVVPLGLIGATELGWPTMVRLGWAVVVFCLAASVVYVWNDLADRYRDQAHPVKRHRPIASGRISVPVGYAYGVALTTALVAAMLFGPQVGWWPLIAYLVLNVAYSRWLKHVPLLDVFIVAAGFVLRLLQGYVALDAAPSHWLVLSVFAVCLLMILGKRRHEVRAAGTGHRPSLAGYSAQYLEHLMVLCGAVTVTALLLHLQDGQTAAPYADLLVLVSVPFALFGLARYLQLVVVGSGGGDPVRAILRDRALLGLGLVWGGSLAAAVLFTRYPVLAGGAG